MNIEELTFSSPEVKAVISSLYAGPDVRAESGKKNRNFQSILINLAELYPEDKEAIFDLMGGAAIQKQTSLKVVVRKDVFGKSPMQENVPCADCPKGTEVIETTPGINKAKKVNIPAELLTEETELEETPKVKDPAQEEPEEPETFALPDELTEEEPEPEKKELRFSNIETRDELLEFLGYEDRSKTDVARDVKGWMDQLKIDTQGERACDTLIDLLWDGMQKGK